MTAAIDHVVLSLVRWRRRPEILERPPLGEGLRCDRPVRPILGGAHRRTAAASTSGLRRAASRRRARLGLPTAGRHGRLVAVTRSVALRFGACRLRSYERARNDA